MRRISCFRQGMGVQGLIIVALLLLSCTKATQDGLNEPEKLIDLPVPQFSMKIEDLHKKLVDNYKASDVQFSKGSEGCSSGKTYFYMKST